MRDRQYLFSLAAFAAVAAVTLGGIVSLVLWLGWVGAIGIGTIAAAFLAWFYLGPRPDRKARSGDDAPDGPESE